MSRPRAQQDPEDKGGQVSDDPSLLLGLFEDRPHALHLAGSVLREPPTEETVDRPSEQTAELERLSVVDARALKGLLTREQSLEVRKRPRRSDTSEL